MPLVMPGHGSVMTRYPPSPLPTELPSSSMMSDEMPGNGVMAAPGFVAVMPGSGVMRMPPVSVCHHVSTMGQRSPPMLVRYQIQASGLMGSPTDPSNRRLERSCEAGSSSPHFMKVRMVVGAV